MALFIGITERVIGIGKEAASWHDTIRLSFSEAKSYVFEKMRVA